MLNKKNKSLRAIFESDLDEADEVDLDEDTEDEDDDDTDEKTAEEKAEESYRLLTGYALYTLESEVADEKDDDDDDSDEDDDDEEDEDDSDDDDDDKEEKPTSESVKYIRFLKAFESDLEEAGETPEDSDDDEDDDEEDEKTELEEEMDDAEVVESYRLPNGKRCIIFDYSRESAYYMRGFATEAATPLSSKDAMLGIVVPLRKKISAFGIRPISKGGKDAQEALQSEIKFRKNKGWEMKSIGSEYGMQIFEATRGKTQKYFAYGWTEKTTFNDGQIFVIPGRASKSKNGHLCVVKIGKNAVIKGMHKDDRKALKKK